MEKRNSKGQTLSEFLADYRPSDYKHPAVTADCVIFARDTKQVLMVKRGNHPCIDEYALPGGFCECGESAMQSARRELLEETGHSIDGLQPLCFVSTPNRDPRDWIMTACFGSVVDRPFDVVGSDDAAEAVWLDIAAVYHSQGKVTLTLGDISVDLVIARDASGRIDIDNTTQTTGIAFDHAKILMYALEWFNI